MRNRLKCAVSGVLKLHEVRRSKTHAMPTTHTHGHTHFLDACFPRESTFTVDLAYLSTQQTRNPVTDKQDSLRWVATGIFNLKREACWLRIMTCEKAAKTKQWLSFSESGPLVGDGPLWAIYVVDWWLNQCCLMACK